MARPRDRPGGRAFRCTWDKCFDVGIKAAVLITKGLHCMHWHALMASSVVLALTLLMTQTTRYVSQVPFLESLAVIRVTGRATRTHIGRSRTCAAAGPAWASKKLRWRQGRSTQGAAGQTCGTNGRVRPIFVNTK